ncbi:ferrous iron transport protein A [Streptomyces sp. NPDC020883]|uniref:ferrous iron transport protein A n=1 Tax=Streptomyces sp. NPDC020883 TaxID=3365099 RepID=UPI0037A7B4D8
MMIDPNLDQPGPGGETVKHALYSSSSDKWPAGCMTPGTRVTVIKDASWDGPWQVEFQGTIDDFGPPEPVQNSSAREGEMAYWVVFDESQYDSSGDGPFRKAWIWDRYLKRNPG